MELAQRRKALHERLQEVELRHNQAEIARKTTTSRNNVSRYARGARMPLDFGAALCSELGVNPAWLLLGEGSPWISDAPEATAKLAGNLLELVQAMNAVSQMRMGSLTGKHYLAVLRELNDALSRYEKLRTQLNERTSTLFSDLLKQYHAVMERRDLVGADGLRKALTQLARLNDDPLLAEEFDRQRAHHEYQSININRACDYLRSVFYRALSRGGLDFRGCEDAHNLAMNLYTGYRVQEARRVCEAALTLAGPGALDHDAGRILDGLLGMLQIELGEVVAGLSRLQRQVALVPNVFKGISSGLLIRAQLLAGVLEPSAAFALGAPSRSKSLRLLQYAIFSEDPALIPRVLRECVGDAPSHKFPPEYVLAQHALHLLNVVTGKNRGALELSRKDMHDRPDLLPEAFNLALWDISNCRLLRIAGKKKDALARLASADEQIARIPAEFTLDVLAMAAHHRNALRLIEPSASGALKSRRALAAAFFRDGLAKGYGIFASEKAAFS